MIEAGKKVICVDAKVHNGKEAEKEAFYLNWVEEGEVYTVRHVFGNDDIVPGLILEEISNPEMFIVSIKRNQEPAFGLFRFRTLTKQEEWLEEDKVREEENKNPKPRELQKVTREEEVHV